MWCKLFFFARAIAVVWASI